MRYGNHDFRYFSKNKRVEDLASPSFLRNLAKKRKTQSIMVYALLAYIAAMLFAQYVPTLLAISETEGDETVEVYNTTLTQLPTPAWSYLDNTGKMGNSDPTAAQTDLLYSLFNELDTSDSLDDITFDQESIVYTPLEGSQMSEFTSATSAKLWTNYDDTRPQLTNGSLTQTGISYSDNWTVTSYDYTTEGDWSSFLYRPDNLYVTDIEPLRPPSDYFDPGNTIMAWTNEYAGTWPLTTKSYLWSSLTYGLVSSSPYNISDFNFFTNLAAKGDNGTGVCVEQSHIDSLLAAVPTAFSTNSAFTQWNTSDSVCELRAVVYVSATGTLVMLGASKTKVTRADYTFAPWLVPPRLPFNVKSPPSPMGQVLNDVANPNQSKATNNLLISADSYLLNPSQQGDLVNTTTTALLLRSRLVDPAIDSPGRNALFLTSVVSNGSLAIPMVLQVGHLAIECPIWVPILSGALALIAIALIVFRGKISGDWDLDLYVLFMDTAEAVGDFGDIVSEAEKHLEVVYDPETGRNILSTPKAILADTILENVISDEKRDMAEDLIDRYSPVDQPLKKASGFLVDTYTTADLKKAVAKIKKAKHDLSAKKSHLKILDTVAQNCEITKEISKKGIDVKDLWELLQEVDFAKVLSLTQKAALAKPKVKVSDIEQMV
ncbi:unnamed protein product [Umbelopsis ramanniana]